MDKFRVGDRVRFIEDNPDGGAKYGKKGDVTEVLKVWRDGSVEVRDPRGIGWNPNAPESALELIGPEPATVPAAPATVPAVHAIRIDNGDLLEIIGGYLNDTFGISQKVEAVRIGSDYFAGGRATTSMAEITFIQGSAA